MNKNSQALTIYNEFNVFEMIKFLWQEKLKIVSGTALAAFLSVIYALSLPNIYISEILLAPSPSTSNGGMGLGQYSGIASLAGISVGSSGTDEVSIGLATLKSRAFLKNFIEERDILVPLMALKSWKNNKPEINEAIYEEQGKKWVNKKPTPQSSFFTFQSMLSVSEDKDTGLVRVAISNKSPVYAQQWVDWVVADLNASIRNAKIKEAKSTISFLEREIASTSLVEMRAMFYQLIQQQVEIMMLANVREDYLFKVVDPAIVPEQKALPNRALICILGTIFGGFLSVISVFVEKYLRRK